jgi:sulfur-carrier protein
MPVPVPVPVQLQVQVRYFAALREALGTHEQVQLRPGANLGELRDLLIARSARHAAALVRTRALRGAINQVLCDEASVVPEGAEVAFFPPVTGG